MQVTGLAALISAFVFFRDAWRPTSSPLILRAMETKSASRLILLAPPALLVGSALVMAIVSPFAWGAASDYKIPAWMTTRAGVAFALAGLAIGLLAFKSVLYRTRREYKAFGFHLIAGIALMLLSTAAELCLAARIANSSTYSGFVDDQGKVLVSSSAFVVFTVFGIVLMSFLTGGFAYIYCQAISDTHLSGAALRRPDEPDAMGEILRSR